MTLISRKLLLTSLVLLIFVVANILAIALWLDTTGVVEWARRLRTEFLTGTALTIIVALLILLVNPHRAERFGLIRRCGVCDKRVIGRATYCSECGSKV